MSKDLINFESEGTLPKSIATVVRPEDIKDDLAHGVVSSFPIISYRGKVWRLRKGDEELIVSDEDGEPKNNIEVVILKANANLSKIYYSKKYSEGEHENPDCFSVDGIYPDPASANKQAQSCASCPNNVWGSRITDSGKKSKACSDSRRVAVSFPNDIARNGDNAKVFLLRIPAASLGTLKEYGDALGNKGYPYFSVATRLSFEIDASYPKFVFRAVRPVTEEEGTTIVTLRDSDKVEAVLGSAVETVAAPETQEKEEPSNVVDLPPKAEPKAKKKSKKAKAKPAPEPEAAPKAEEKAEESKVLSELDDLLSALD